MRQPPNKSTEIPYAIAPRRRNLPPVPVQKKICRDPPNVPQADAAIEAFLITKTRKVNPISFV
jgi:hypothetical protein